jgi:hypothetical protein
MSLSGAKQRKDSVSRTFVSRFYCPRPVYLVSSLQHITVFPFLQHLSEIRCFSIYEVLRTALYGLSDYQAISAPVNEVSQFSPTYYLTTKKWKSGVCTRWQQWQQFPVIYTGVKLKLGFSIFCHFVGFVVLKALVKESSVFSDVTPCSLLKVNRRFGGTYRLHLQGRRISQTRNQRESSPFFHAGILLESFFS